MRVAADISPLRALISRFSLRTSLAILLAIVVAILVVDRSRELTRIRSHEIAMAHAQVMESARRGAERQTDVIAGLKAMLNLAVGRPETSAGAGMACRNSFREIVDELPWLRSLLVAGVDGRVLCTTTANTSTTSLSDRAYFKQAIASRDFVLSDYIIGRLSGKPGIVGALPRITDGKVETVVIGSLEIDWLSQIAGDIGSPQAAQALLLDSAGTVVASSSQPDKWVGRKLAGNAPFLTLIRSDNGVTVSDSVDRRRQIIGHVRLRDTNAVLVVMLPLESVIASANDRMRYEIGKILLAAGVAFLVIWFGGDRLLMRPIRNLSRKVALFGAGELDTRIYTEGLAPELKRLGESFNAMAIQLREREDDLRRANERLADLAARDALTGIANRRGFDDQFAAEWNRARRAGDPLALVVLDVDHFKKFNDRYGHLAGDACLQRVAAALRRIARRAGDFPARTGGEEFALLLPKTDLNSAGSIAEAVRLEIEALNIAHKSSPEARVTVSVGAAACRADRAEDMHGLVDLADAALYRAKRGGRNCVVLDGTAISLAS